MYNKPRFSQKQLDWIRDMLTPACCHVTEAAGHPNDHFLKDAGTICDCQRVEAYNRLSAAMGFDGPLHAISHPTCETCWEARREATAERTTEGLLPLRMVVTELVRSSVTGEELFLTGEGEFLGSKWRVETDEAEIDEAFLSFLESRETRFLPGTRGVYRGHLRVKVGFPRFDPLRPIPRKGYPVPHPGVWEKAILEIRDAVVSCGAMIDEQTMRDGWLLTTFRKNP